MTPFDLILAILCAYRLTQLVTWDDLLSPVTCWLANKHRLLDELFGCPHCMGFWCALVTVVAVIQDHWLIRIGVWAFAVSGAVSMIQHATGWLDIGEALPPYPGQDPQRPEAERVSQGLPSHIRRSGIPGGMADYYTEQILTAATEGNVAGETAPLSTAEIIKLGEADGYAYKGGYEPPNRPWVSAWGEPEGEGE